MGQHRADPVRHLDHVLGGLKYLGLHNPNLNEGFLQATRYQYRKLRETLLETNVEASIRMPHSTIIRPCVLRRLCIGSRAIFTCTLPLPGR